MPDDGSILKKMSTIERLKANPQVPGNFAYERQGLSGGDDELAY